MESMIGELWNALSAWHGTIDAQPDIPDDLKQAVQELDADDLVDFDDGFVKP